MGRSLNIPQRPRFGFAAYPCDIKVTVLAPEEWTRWLCDWRNEHNRQFAFVPFIDMALVVCAWNDVGAVVYIRAHLQFVLFCELNDGHWAPEIS